MILNPTLCARLASEAREDHERMSEAPWTVESDTIHSGGTAIAEFTGEAMLDDDPAVARQRNNLEETAEQLAAAAKVGEAVRRLHASSERAALGTAEPMRLVRQDVLDELLALIGGDQ